LALLAVNRAFKPPLIVDIGAGSGAGGIVAASHLGEEVILALTDINPKALRLCEVNAALNGTTAHCMRRDVLQEYQGEADFIVANPPYLIDQTKRAYRHGGGEWGCDLSLRILEEGLCHLSRGGKFLLYTGTPVVRGTDVFLEAAKPVLGTLCSSYRYEEVDVDVFGEELDRAPYDRADRLAAVALNVNGKDLL
jgi:methylase of polypeptide subunit release factors